MTFKIGQLIGTDVTCGISSRINRGRYPFIGEDALVGIEIEMENFVPPKGSPIYWSCVGDGSLREGGVEFVSRILGSRDVLPALEEIGPVLERCRPSWRAGIHVHVDASRLTLEQVASACRLYALLEPLIFAWEGNGRDKNNFCPPWSVLPSHAENLMNAIACFRELEQSGNTDITTHRATLLKNISRSHKYISLNLNSLIRLGSLEFRLMQSTKDIEKIGQYVKLCSSIVEVGARSVGESFLDTLSGEGADSIIDMLHLPFLKQVEDYRSLMWEGVHVLNMLYVAGIPESKPVLDIDVLEIKLLGED